MHRKQLIFLQWRQSAPKHGSHHAGTGQCKAWAQVQNRLWDSQVPLGENATACTDPGDLQCAQMLQDLLPVAAQHAVNTQIVRHTEYGVEVRDDGHGLSGQSLLLVDLVTSARCSCSTCGYWPCCNTRNNTVVIVQNNRQLRFFHFHDYYFDTATKCCTWWKDTVIHTYPNRRYRRYRLDEKSWLPK